MIKEIRGWFGKNRWALVIIALVVVLVVAFSAVRLAQYIDYIYGSEVLVSLDSSKSDLSLVNGQSEEISFSVKRVTRPFCSTQCFSVFESLGDNSTFVKQELVTGPNQEKEIFVNVTARGDNFGQDFFRFSVECRNVQSVLCPTTGEPISRTKLITLTRELNEAQKNALNSTGDKIANLASNLSRAYGEIRGVESNVAKLNDVLDVADFNSSAELLSEFNLLNESFSGVLDLWRMQNGSAAVLEMENISLNINELAGKTRDLSSEVSILAEEYNSFVLGINRTRQAIENVSQRKYLIAERDELDSSIISFNRLVVNFSLVRNIAEKKSVFAEIEAIDFARFGDLALGDDSVYSVQILPVVNVKEIVFANSPFEGNFTLPAQEPICCAGGRCEVCCADCADKFPPILMLHGHDFSKDISAEFSLNIFDELQRELDSDGYINAGEIAISNPDRQSGILGLQPASLTFRGTYYFDAFKSSDGYVPIQTKSENIDTYALRVANLVEEIKRETGKDKVVLVTHSMGGLVARRYIQIFGNESVAGLVMVAAPNNGITESLAKSCSLFGTDRECQDMTEGSLFLNKLTESPTDSVATYNLYGSGCVTDGEDGDGIVSARSARLNSAENFVVNGTCSGVYLLHGSILKKSVHPETFERIKEILGELI